MAAGGHAPPLRCEGNEVSDNLFRIGCLQNRDPRADADRPGDGHADADKRHGAESGRGRPHERVADAGQPVRHGGGAGLWLRLPRQAALNLRTDLSRYAFYGAKLVLHYGLQLPGGRWETVPLGVYTVAEAERRALYVSIKAYDNILALQQKYDGTTMQGTAYALLGQIAAAVG